jgi:hypothetical protein
MSDHAHLRSGFVIRRKRAGYPLCAIAHEGAFELCEQARRAMRRRLDDFYATPQGGLIQ